MSTTQKRTDSFLNPDQASALFGYCEIIMDYLRPILNNSNNSNEQHLRNTLINLQSLMNEIFNNDSFIGDLFIVYNKVSINTSETFRGLFTSALNSLLPYTFSETPHYSFKTAIETAFNIALEVEDSLREKWVQYAE